MTRIIDTGLRPVWSDKATDTGLFIPLTGPINTVHINDVRFSYYIESGTGSHSWQRAYNMSDEGETWSSTVTGIGSFSISTGWVWDEAAATTVSTNLKNFVRFGLIMKNKTGDKLNRALARARLEVTPTSGQTLVAGPIQVWSDGTTGGLFHPMTPPVPFQAIEEIRASLELEGDSGDAQIQAAYQLGNDGQDWDETGGVWDFTTFGSVQDGNGINYGGSFTSFAPSVKQLVRFGIVCANGSAGKTENCLASLRVDYRMAT